MQATALIIIIVQICSFEMNTLGWKILEACVNACWVYSVEAMSKMQFVLSIPCFIFFVMCGFVCVKLVIQV